MRHSIRISLLVTLTAARAALPAGLAGQAEEPGRPIDRWLVTETGTGVDAAAAQLVDAGDRQFPERALEVGPGMWRLVREDGTTMFRFERDEEGATLAHAYLKSGADGLIDLDVSTPGCDRAGVWLNGQRLEGHESPFTVELANGWNTLLVGLPASCAAELGAVLRTAHAPLPRDTRPLDPGRLGVQASRPPGIRPNLPAGTVTLGMPRPTELVWRAGEDRLAARVAYAVAAWGREPGSGTPETPAAEEEEHDAPPSVDLTGEWSITLYLPTGVERLRAHLEMAGDGHLEGRLEGERVDGSIHAGWVSEDRFGWTARWSGAGRGTDVRFRGRVEADRMSGTIEVEGPRDREPRPGFESGFGFEGRRGARSETGRDTTVAPIPGAEQGREPAAPARPRQGGPPGFGPPADTETLHAQIRRQLLPPRRPEAPAPGRVSIELRFDGEELVGSAGDLRPARAVTLTGTVPFAKVRAAALDDRGLRARIAWGGSTREREGRLAPAAVLEAFHAPILLAEADSTDRGRLEGTFRVPKALDGFTLRTLDGQWSVDGAAVSDARLCSPCREGTRLRIRVTGALEARVQVVDPGYPQARDAAGAAAAEEWLRALSDGRRYRQMGAAAGGSSAGSFGGLSAVSAVAGIVPLRVGRRVGLRVGLRLR